jgi:bifunctional non-homologous end joining protein LigD
MPAAVETALKAYRAKRRFGETAEPAGGGKAAAGALYLVQKHDARRLHYDFRLELDGVLLSWAVTRGPSYNTKDKRLAVRTEDHPLEYGRFEGTIPPDNYGAGTVMLWDTGSWAPVGDARKGLDDGKLAFELHGERLRGRWALVRMRPDAKARRENWLLIKESDEYANTEPDLLEAETLSAASGRSLEEIAKGGKVWRGADRQKNLPPYREPMLATLMDEPPRGAGWIFEVKYDGYRVLIAADGDDVRIYTRSGLDWTAKFRQIAKAVAAMRLDRVLLDGEIVVIDGRGRTDFAALVAALESGKGALSCFVFDLLQSGGKDFGGKPLSARKAALKRLLGEQDKNAPVQYSEDFAGAADTGVKLAKSACEHGLEGIIAKRADAPYRSGRHGDWLKIKCGHEQEFVIVGFSASARGRAFASILLAVNDNGALRYAGRVGSGFSEVELGQLAKLRDKNEVKKLCADVPGEMRRGVTWVKPAMIAQVEFAGWTGDRMIRHGRFKGLRGDKSLKEIVREMPKPAKAVRRVEITHGERIVYPDDGVSKADLAAYLQRAAPFMLPFIKDRFVSFLRCPGGLDKKGFFQRHPMAGLGDGWVTQAFTHKQEPAEYVFCKKPEALGQAVQMGAVEFHIWGSKVNAVEKPDRIVFDLDPDEGLAFDTVKEAACRLRDVLAALDLQSLPLLSGGKGIHVVAPILPRHEWPVIKAFAGTLAARVAEDAPRKFVATMTKAKRKGKIFIDYFRNDVTATAIAPYSPRARKGAAVAWPLSWAALQSADAANSVSIGKAAAALAAGENGWAEYGKIKQQISAAALRALEVGPREKRKSA